MTDTNQKSEVVGKKHARPGSRWNSTNRHPQKAFDQPKGFARGCKVSAKQSPQPR